MAESAPRATPAPVPRIDAEVVPEATRVRDHRAPVDEPVPENAVPRRRATWRAWTAVTAVVALTVVTLVRFADHPPHGVVATTADPNPGGAANQDAGVLGDNIPPGVPHVRATRTGPTRLRFTWTYSARLRSDTFRWRTPDGTRSGIAKAPALELSDPVDTSLCLQVKVIRADGSHAAVDWSPRGCGR
jgi:hypothetical protein